MAAIFLFNSFKTTLSVHAIHMSLCTGLFLNVSMISQNMSYLGLRLVESISGSAWNNHRDMCHTLNRPYFPLYWEHNLKQVISLDKRPRRRSNIKPALFQHLVVSVY